MAEAAGLLRSGPFKEIVRRAADLCGRGESAEAVLAALVLVAKGPHEAGDGAEFKSKNLKRVGGHGHAREERQAEVRAEQEGEDEEQRGFCDEKELAADPAEGLAGGALVDVAAGGGREGDDDDEHGLDEEARNARVDDEAELVPAGCGEAEESRDDAEAGKRGEAEDGGTGVGAAPAFGAQPECIAKESGGEARDGVGPTAAIVHVPELGVPVAAPFVAIGGGD